MAKFPVEVPTFPARAALQPIFPQHINGLQDEVVAIATKVLATPANTVRSPLILQATNPTLELNDTGPNAAKGRAQVLAGPKADLTTNVRFDGVNWVVDDLTQQVTLLRLGANDGTLRFLRAPAGSNPPAWTEAFAVPSTGHIYERGRSVAMGVWQGYTPVWQSSGNPQPVLGNGSCSGVYTVIGKTVHARITFTIGSTTTQGAGFWYWSIPPGLPMPASGMDCAGCARLAMFVNNIGEVLWVNQGNVGVIAEGSANAIAGPGTPVAWTTGGYISMWFTYEVQ
jgi:hypothetical protein